MINTFIQKHKIAEGEPSILEEPEAEGRLGVGGWGAKPPMEVSSIFFTCALMPESLSHTKVRGSMSP